MHFEIGQKIGGYEIVEIRETEASGVTFKVRNVLAQRFEVLKILPKGLRDDQERVDRFLRETKIRARLSHPNIVSFYNAMELEDQLVMTTELVEGSTLEALLKTDTIDTGKAVDYTAQALSALVYAHANGVVHRNLSPANMIVTEQGSLKLMDFGLAKMYVDPSLTQAGTMIGSLHYTAPEQVRGLPTLDERTDIYAMGSILYELLIGRKLFEGKGQFEVMQAHVQEDPPAPSTVNPALSEELSQVVMRALAKEPAERFQTAVQFRSALHAGGVEVTEAQPSAALDAQPVAAPADAIIESPAGDQGAWPTTPGFDGGPTDPATAPSVAAPAVTATAVAEELTAQASPQELLSSTAAHEERSVSEWSNTSGAAQPLPERAAAFRDSKERTDPEGQPNLFLIGGVTFAVVAVLFYIFLTVVNR